MEQFVWGIHRWPLESPHKGPVRQKMFTFDDVIMTPWRFIGGPQSWWRHQMETFSALLAICAENSPVPGEFPAQRPVTRSFDVCFELRLNKRLSKQSWGWWSETQSRPLWCHSNGKCSAAPSPSGAVGIIWDAISWWIGGLPPVCVGIRIPEKPAVIDGDMPSVISSYNLDIKVGCHISRVCSVDTI